MLRAIVWVGMYYCSQGFGPFLQVEALIEHVVHKLAANQIEVVVASKAQAMGLCKAFNSEILF